jgi:hypothetical protein
LSQDEANIKDMLARRIPNLEKSFEQEKSDFYQGLNM